MTPVHKIADAKPESDIENPRDSVDSLNATPLPWRIIGCLSIVMFSEPISLTILFPFVYFMVKDFHLSQDERDIGYYVGLIASAFSLAQFCTSLGWGWLSDRIGRRPILLIGLAGNTLTMLAFGLSRSLAWAILSRALCGALNGNIAVAKTVLGEITDSSNRAFGFSVFGFTWGIGMVMGPAIGGFLAFPTKYFPSLFGGCTFLEANPYFLPCLVSALISVAGFLIGIFVLPETNPCISQELGYRENLEEQDSFTTILPADGFYRDAEDPDDEETDVTENTPLLPKDVQAPPPLGYATYNTVIGYGAISFFNIILDETFPLWASTAPALGGLGFNSYDIGIALSIAGISTILSQAGMIRVLRSQNCLFFFRISVAAYVLVFPLYPLMNTLLLWKPDYLWPCLLLIMALRQLISAFAYTAISILTTNAAPPERLGTAHALGQTLASLVRGIGPALGGVMYAWSLQNHLGFPFDRLFIFVSLVVMAFVTTLFAYLALPNHL